MSFTSLAAAESEDRIDLKSAPVLTVLEADRYWGALGLYSAGDINGDGVGDLIAEQAGGAEEFPQLDVLFGPFPSEGTLDLNAAGHDGFTILPPAVIGLRPAAAGDVNGDGYGDLIIGAKESGEEKSGKTYVVFGKSGNEDIDLADFEAETQQDLGFRIDGAGFLSLSGSEVGALGDVNGDGFDDLMVGAPLAPAVYVVFGKPDVEVVNLGDLYDGSSDYGYVIVHPAPHTSNAWDAAPAGDFNGDGVTDVIVGLYRRRNMPGGAWIVYGKSDSTRVDVSALGDRGVRIRGSYGRSGEQVTGTGDWNGDGCDDVAVAAPARKRTYVVYGCHGWQKIWAGSLGKHGSAIQAPDGYVLTTLSGGSDVNGDGRAELAIGEPYSAPFGRKGAGSIFVILGGEDFKSIKASKNRKRVIRIDGADECTDSAPNCAGDFLGSQIDLTQDIDGDGWGDLLAGAYDPTRNYEGRAYVVWSSIMWAQ